jgi:hypothetical protein
VPKREIRLSPSPVDSDDENGVQAPYAETSRLDSGQHKLNTGLLLSGMAKSQTIGFDRRISRHELIL